MLHWTRSGGENDGEHALACRAKHPSLTSLPAVLWCGPREPGATGNTCAEHPSRLGVELGPYVIQPGDGVPGRLMRIAQRSFARIYKPLTQRKRLVVPLEGDERVDG